MAGTSAPCCDDPGRCELRRILDEVDDTVRTTFAAVSLATLIRSPRTGIVAGEGAA